jgi:opacity protein-like surface antigen
MKKLTLSVAVACAFALPQVFAQSQGFQGLSAGVGFNVAQSTSDLALPGNTRSLADTDNNFALQVQYNVAMNQSFLLGLGTNIGFGNLNAGQFARGQAKIKDSYSLYIAPSLAINDSWLAYGKLAYLNAKAENAYGRSVNFDNGYGYGIGLQVQYNKNWFGQAELMINQYNDKSPAPGETDKLKNGVYSLTAGYKF